MKYSDKKAGVNDLRFKAEAFLKSKSVKTDAAFSESEMLKLIYELEVHQIEIEMQNERLLEAIGQAETAKRQSDIESWKFSELYNSAPLGFFTLDRSGEICSVNQYGLQMLGKQLSQIKNSLFGFYIAESSKPDFNQFLERIFLRKTKEICEVTFYVNDRVPFYFLLTGIVIEKSELCLVNMIDITVIKESEEELRTNNMRMDLAMQGGKMAWWEMDIPTGNVTFSNQKAEMLGYPPDKFKHYTDFTDLVHPEDYPKIMNAMKGHFEGVYDKYETEYRILAKSGEYLWFNDYGSVVKKDAGGKPLICSGFVYNITEQKKVKDRLFYINKAVESSSNAIGISDALGNHFYQNKALSELFGYETAEDMAKAGGGQAVIKDPEVVKEMFGSIMDGNSWCGELEMVTKNGRVFPAYEQADAIKDSNGNIIGFIGVVTDITKQKIAEEILQKSERMLQSVLDHFPGVVFWKDKGSVYLGCNQNFATGAGLNNSAEIVGKTDFELPWGETEAEHYRADDFEVMENGRQKLNILESQLQSDGRIMWFDTSKLPFLDSKGQIVGLIGISNDISKLKTVESELILANKELIFENIEKGKRSEELVIANRELLFQIEENEKRSQELITANYKAEESNRLKSAFLSNISHEIRTPFNVILGFLKLILEEELATDERVLFGQMINQSASRLMNTIDDIIEISKLQSGSLEIFATEFNIKLLMNELFNHFKCDCEVKALEIKVNHDLINNREYIFTDRLKLGSILSKLIENAIKYTKRGSIDFGYTFKTASWICEADDPITPTEIEFYVRDTGIGISKTQQTKIFERFRQADVSTTREFEGTGLGLAITKAYVEGLGGKLWVESEVGKGSTFYFTFPIICET